MSHLTHVQTTIKDPTALAAACAALGVSIVEQAQARFYFGMSEVCDYVIKLPGRYDLGLKKQDDGTYTFVADEELMGGQYGTDGAGRGDAGRKLIGEEAGKLKQEYAYALLQAQARKRGHSIHRETLATGQIRVTMRGRM